MVRHLLSFSLQMAKPDGGQIIDKKINCRFDVEGAFKTTNEQSQGSIDGAKAGEAAAEEGVCAFQSSTDAAASGRCPVSRCTRTCIITGLFILLLAIAIIYFKFGDKLMALLHKVDVIGVIRAHGHGGSHGAHGHARGNN